jgi:hypothetical protein
MEYSSTPKYIIITCVASAIIAGIAIFIFFRQRKVFKTLETSLREGKIKVEVNGMPPPSKN